MSTSLDWTVARCGVEIGVTWFRQHDADKYPRLYIGAAKYYQDEMLAAVQGLSRTDNASDMTVDPDALDEHWQQSEWKRGG